MDLLRFRARNDPATARVKRVVTTTPHCGMTRRIALRIALGGAGATTEGASLVTAFTGRVFGVLAATPGNIVVSPYSVAFALGMTRNGAG